MIQSRPKPKGNDIRQERNGRRGVGLYSQTDDSEIEMESLSHGTDNVEIKSNPRVSCTDYSEKSFLNSAQGKIDVALSVII